MRVDTTTTLDTGRRPWLWTHLTEQAGLQPPAGGTPEDQFPSHFPSALWAKLNKESLMC